MIRDYYFTGERPEDFEDERPRPCSHYWIDPEEPPFQRTAYSPVIGNGWHEMKSGKTYKCLNCKQLLRVTGMRVLKKAVLF